MLESKINTSQYTLESIDINRKHLIRLNRSMNEQFESSKDCIVISYENELPLAQCRQKFTSMEAPLRNGVKESIESKAEKYQYMPFFVKLFIARYTYCHRFSACDVALSASALLHFGGKASVEQNFLCSLDALSRKHTNVLYKGVELFKTFLKVSLSEVCTYLNNGSVIPNNVILQCVISQETPGWKFFSKPFGIVMFGNFLLRAFVQTPKGNKHRNKPLVLAVSLRNEENTSLVVGVPPIYVQLTGEKPTKYVFVEFFIN
ncbi:unnamed protein product [Soboliphyme baturini]|uniref:Rho-GAP domain-containing protein n=1 Tax=Soboliphyme baturini TaxID=241478 RepID=A0A183IYU8_9BILA|nr:unnamed protein product [Soboliphyme baturini]